MPNHECYEHHLQLSGTPYLSQASYKISVWSLKDFFKQNFKRVGHFYRFQPLFSTLKGKIRKVWKSWREIIIYTFSTYFLLQASPKSASRYIFCERYGKKCQKIMVISENKGLSNLIQASIINKTCLFLAQLQHLEIQKSYRGWICKFLI